MTLKFRIALLAIIATIGLALGSLLASLTHAAGPACVPGQAPGTQCCSPEVPAAWACGQGSIELAGACKLPSGAEGRLYRCVTAPPRLRAGSQTGETQI